VTAGLARVLPLAAIGVLSCAVYAVGFDLGLPGEPTRWFPVLYYPLFALFLGAAWWVWRHPGLGVWPVLVFAVAFRVFAAGDPPSLSSDIHRYAWDGQVQRAGINPYAYPPGDPELEPLRDEAIHPRINRPEARTVYPPGGQVLYRFLPYDLYAIRLVMIGFDGLTILLLARLLTLLRRDPARVVLYAWSPLVVYEVGNNGHLEAAMLPFLVGTVLVFRMGRVGAAGWLLGGAVSMKLYPVLAAAGLARDRPWRLLAPIGAVVGLLYLVYGWSVGSRVLGFLPDYVRSAEDHNIGLRRVFEWVLAGWAPHPREVAFGLCLVLLVTGLVWIWRHPASPERQMLRISGLYLLTLPTALHPWYALWLFPWLCVYPRASWLWFMGALPLSYLKYGAPGGVMPGWVVPTELVPTLILLGVEARRSVSVVQGSIVFGDRPDAPHPPPRE
jgi:hypothetical protein